MRVILVVAGLALGCPQLLKDEFVLPEADASDSGADARLCEPFELCGSACVDVQSSALHCGACGSAIEADQICSTGKSVSVSVGCGTRTLCDRGCVDTQTSPFACGACGITCKPGARCILGRCACGPPAGKDCGSACRECCADADCPMDKLCSAGVCELNCVQPQTQCGDRCANLHTDPKNCGSCRNDCGPARVCVDGACR